MGTSCQQEQLGSRLRAEQSEAVAPTAEVAQFLGALGYGHCPFPNSNGEPLLSEQVLGARGGLIPPRRSQAQQHVASSRSREHPSVQPWHRPLM